MSRIRNRILLLIVSWSAVACSASDSPGIGGTKARELIQAGALLVDVRSSLEYRFWTPIEGAVNIPAGDLEEKMATLEKTRAVIVYSRTGGRSADAKDMLTAAGFDAYNLGGLADWER